MEDRLCWYTRVSPGGCWEWTGCLFTAGYGAILVGGKKRSAHRISYELRVGPIPEDKELDHLCRNRACINPAHLEPVTRRENVRRGVSCIAAHMHKTHCKNGHEFTPDNTYKKNRIHRSCRKCVLAAQARYQQRLKLREARPPL